MSLSSPKRSHSLIHHHQQKQQQQQHQLPEQQREQLVNRLQPCIQPPQRTSSVREHQSVRLTRSSSLSHLSRKAPMRSKSLPQKPTGKLNEPLPPVPPFLFQDPEPLQPTIIPPTRSSSLHRPRRLKKNQQDDEITEALLEWKHKSVFKVDWATMFTSSVELWKMDDKIFGSIEDLVALKDDDDKQVKETVRSLWIQDEECMPKKEIAAYIGKLDPFCHRVLKLYMDQFDFTGMALDEAFRKLCQKLYFKAEAQEIDRILEVFSHRFWNQNPDKRLYKNADLHLVQISSHSKMTSDLFCENTMSTVLEQKIFLDGDESTDQWKGQLEVCLRDIYTSVKNQGILQPISEDDAPKSFLKRMGSMTQRKKKGSSSSSLES
ncbi:hypothetical protein HMPREF1544_03372 [Mucor circinelloides 1006PhL]|uniref:SEC7 domain-containing protein n=1 Tax=Mucor circinelloides f. circinelloides (strain 1006PhL) TaxID=1220926 RepID=S2KC18_MUCC1|nr:hypothetical protein HMPREF1544_03372 [Mucor circinelloides 1006PhL]